MGEIGLGHGNNLRCHVLQVILGIRFGMLTVFNSPLGPDIWILELEPS